MALEVFFKSFQSSNLLINFGLDESEIRFVTSTSILGGLELILEEFKESLSGGDEFSKIG